MLVNNQFKTFTEFLNCFKDENVCKNYFEVVRFKNGLFCPHCGQKKINRFSDKRRFRCYNCKKDFTLRSGTIFAESKIPFRAWFIGIYLLTTGKKNTSKVELAKQVGVSIKTILLIERRLRHATKNLHKHTFVEVVEIIGKGTTNKKH